MTRTLYCDYNDDSPHQMAGTVTECSSRKGFYSRNGVSMRAFLNGVWERVKCEVSLLMD